MRKLFDRLGFARIFHAAFDIERYRSPRLRATDLNRREDLFIPNILFWLYSPFDVKSHC